MGYMAWFMSSPMAAAWLPAPTIQSLCIAHGSPTWPDRSASRASRMDGAKR